MSRFEEKLGAQFVVSVEVDPPRSPSADALISRLADFPPVDTINIADSPMARVRMSAVALGHLLLARLGLEPVLHYTCRDKNVLGIQSELLGAQALGLRNLLALTGDPVTIGDYPWATAVSDLSSVGLLELVSTMNSGRCLAGKPLDHTCAFCAGAAVNLAPDDLELERAKLKAKLNAGARFLISQPLYDLRQGELMLEVIAKENIPLLVGLIPLISSKLADYLHFEVPGISVPEPLRNRLSQAASPAEQRHIGIQEARELLHCLSQQVQGVCLMPLGHLDLVQDILVV